MTVGDFRYWLAGHKDELVSGFHPGRGAHDSLIGITQAWEYVARGYRIVVDLDLEKLFDRVNHNILMSRLLMIVKARFWHHAFGTIRRRASSRIMCFGQEFEIALFF